MTSLLSTAATALAIVSQAMTILKPRPPLQCQRLVKGAQPHRNSRLIIATWCLLLNVSSPAHPSARALTDATKPPSPFATLPPRQPCQDGSQIIPPCVNRGDIVRPWSHGAGSECSVLIYYSHNSHSLFNYTRIDR